MSTYHLVPVESEDFENVFISWMDNIMESIYFDSEPHLKRYEQEFKILYGSHTKSRARAVTLDISGMQHLMKKENTDSGILVYSSDWVTVSALKQIAGTYKSRRATAKDVQMTATSSEALSSIFGWNDKPIPDVNLLTISRSKLGD